MASAGRARAGRQGGEEEGEEDRPPPRFYHLRPVEGKGLKPIVLRESETVVVGRSERLGISNAKIGAKHLECRLTLSPVVAVELRASEVVYVKDRFGVLKMLKANFIGYLKMGEVLYLCATKGNKLPQYGYILTEGMPKTRKASDARGNEEPASADAPTGEGKDCIDLLDDHSDGEGGATDTAAREQSAKRNTSEKGKKKRQPSQPKAENEGKGTADDPCELLSSDDEVVISEPDQKSKARNNGTTTKKGGRSADKTTAGRGQGGRGKEKAKGKSKEPERDPPKSQREESGQRRGFQDNTSQAAGAGPSSTGFTNHTHAPYGVPHVPPEPAPNHHDDTPLVTTRRANLLTTWRRFKAAHTRSNELLIMLRAKQEEYRVAVAQGRMFSHGSSSYQAQLINVTRVGAAVEELMRLHHVAITEVTVIAAQYKRAVEELDNAILTMKRQRHASTHQRHGEAKATDFQAEVKAWELVEQTADLNVFPAGELKRIAIAMGVDVTGCLEKSEFVKSIAAKRDNGKEAWLVRKRKRGAEEEIAARQRKKLAELRNEEAKREADEGAQASAKQFAASQVAAWARNADLRLFLQRCGITVEGTGRTKKALAGAYKRAMLKFHPDRTQKDSTEQRILAAEVTKWITHAWQNLS